VAVQIGQGVASGVPIGGMTCEAAQQKVLHVDFELSAKQFEQRYSDDQGNAFEFSPNFCRAAIRHDIRLPDGVNFESYLMKSIEATIVEMGVRVLIVDNITFLWSQTETAKDALPLMKKLMELKRRYGLTLILIAHTPKRDSSKPLDLNDLQGSKMLSNFADAVIAVGKSCQDPSLRYLKQLKQRDDKVIYGADNVAVFAVEKPSNFLGLKFLRCEPECDHLETTNILRKPARADAKKWLEMALSSGAIPSNEVEERAAKRGISRSTLFRAKKELKIVSGKIGFENGWAWLPPGSENVEDLRIAVGGKSNDTHNLAEGIHDGHLPSPSSSAH